MGMNRAQRSIFIILPKESIGHQRWDDWGEESGNGSPRFGGWGEVSRGLELETTSLLQPVLERKPQHSQFAHRPVCL
jgi:hypothetical protein